MYKSVCYNFLESSIITQIKSLKLFYPYQQFIRVLGISLFLYEFFLWRVRTDRSAAVTPPPPTPSPELKSLRNIFTTPKINKTHNTTNWHVPPHALERHTAE